MYLIQISRTGTPRILEDAQSRLDIQSLEHCNPEAWRWDNKALKSMWHIPIPLILAFVLKFSATQISGETFRSFTSERLLGNGWAAGSRKAFVRLNMFPHTWLRLRKQSAFILCKIQAWFLHRLLLTKNNTKSFDVETRPAMRYGRARHQQLPEGLSLGLESSCGVQERVLGGAEIVLNYACDTGGFWKHNESSILRAEAAHGFKKLFKSLWLAESSGWFVTLTVYLTKKPHCTCTWQMPNLELILRKFKSWGDDHVCYKKIIWGGGRSKEKGYRQTCWQMALPRLSNWSPPNMPEYGITGERARVASHGL